MTSELRTIEALLPGLSPGDKAKLLQWLVRQRKLPAAGCPALRERGHDVLTIQETGNAGDAVPNTEVLLFAPTEKRAVLTLNRKDFIRLHQQSPVHAGIIVCTFDPDFPAQAERIHQTTRSRQRFDG